MRLAPPALLAALALLAACASAHPRREEVRFPPEIVEVSPLDLELEGKNDAELQAIGAAALGAGDHRRAAAAFDRLVGLFPGSPHRAGALYDGGRAHQHLGEWRAALERFRALEREGGAAEAAFRAAECHYHLGELEDARAVLDGLAARADLSTGDRVRALAQRGVVELEAGRPEDAERTLRLAMSAWRAAAETERLDPYYAAQAQYYLGEVFRGWFSAVRLDPAASAEEQLARELEYKAQLLLSAQGHYLRAMRVGDPEWAIAAGYRIGELYDELHRELTEAPAPPGLDAEEAAAYRAELSRRVKVLVTKAIAIYERTLAAAQRTGAESPYVERIQASLERMKRTLLDASGGADPASAPIPPGADPEEDVPRSRDPAGGGTRR